MSPLPLPPATERLVEQERGRIENVGLLLDRYPRWGRDWQLGGEGKRALMQEAAERAKGAALARLAEAQALRWAARPHGTSFELRPEWRLIVGLGGASVLETSLSLHRIYGLPTIPGSAIKGMTRAYAELVLRDRGEASDAQIRAIFGPEPEGFVGVAQEGRPRWEATSEQVGEQRATKLFWAGQVRFLDAVPLTPVRLDVDVMNPHYGEWYLKKHPAPGDYLSPVPVAFLTVGRETRFRFGVAATRQGGDAEGPWAPAAMVATAARWVHEALTTVGVGAKTAAGYGFFSE